jgi:alkylated DNA nucleotide flippase Atl1
VTSPPAEGFRDRVAAAVAAIPPGTVSTYGEVAVEAGFAVGASRAVGNVLQQVEGLPWWRVVTASGRLVPGIEARHARLLEAEGVPVVDGRVRLGGRTGRHAHRSAGRVGGQHG